MHFTTEEKNMLCGFDTSSRAALIRNINTDFPHIKPELREIAENILRKLYNISDTEFLTLTLSPVNFNDDEKTEV